MMLLKKKTAYIDAERGLLRASSNASPTLRSIREPLPSGAPFRRRPEGWRRPRRVIDFLNARETKKMEKICPLTFFPSEGKQKSESSVSLSFLCSRPGLFLFRSSTVRAHSRRIFSSLHRAPNGGDPKRKKARASSEKSCVVVQRRRSSCRHRHNRLPPQRVR